MSLPLLPPTRSANHPILVCALPRVASWQPINAAATPCKPLLSAVPKVAQDKSSWFACAALPEPLVPLGAAPYEIQTGRPPSKPMQRHGQGQQQEAPTGVSPAGNTASQQRQRACSVKCPALRYATQLRALHAGRSRLLWLSHWSCLAGTLRVPPSAATAAPAATAASVLPSAGDQSRSSFCL